MNRLFRFLFAALIWLTANPAIAQNPMLEIRRPKIINAIEVIADGVNIRKSPSSNAPKLLWWCEGESDDCMYVWSTPNKYRGASPATADKGAIFAVISETPEWYEVITHYTGMVGYISKQFIKEAKLDENYTRNAF